MEEQLCPNCKNSLEDSQLFTGRMSNASGREEKVVRELSERLNELERQVLTYRERVSYHESVEDELKRNIEGQVDVVLRMEEERLLMIKENKEIREKNRALIFENEDYR